MVIRTEDEAALCSPVSRSLDEIIGHCYAVVTHLGSSHISGRGWKEGGESGTILTWPTLTVPQWGTANAEIKVPSVENPELTHVFPLKLEWVKI